MGFMSKACSFTRFRLVDPVPETLFPEIGKLIQEKRFFELQAGETSAAGWVSFEDYLSCGTDEGFDPMKGAFCVFSLRIDTLRIPNSVFKKEYDVAIAREKATTGNKKITKYRRTELKELVKLSLYRRYVPVPGVYNVIWGTAKGEVWLASTQNAVVSAFMDLFNATFDIHLEQLTPTALALSILGQEREEEVMGIKPTRLTSEEEEDTDATPNTILGQSFLTWLWWKASTTVATADNPVSFPVSINTRIVVTGGDGAEKETVMVTSKVLSPLKEAKIGLARGKKVSRAAVYLIADDFAYEATIDAQNFALSGVRPPEIEGEEKADADGLLLEKIFLIQKVVSQLDAHYRDFLTVRMDGEEWEKTAKGMSKWIMEG